MTDYLRIHLGEELHLKFKKACVTEGRTMNNVVVELIEGWLWSGIGTSLEKLYSLDCAKIGLQSEIPVSRVEEIVQLLCGKFDSSTVEPTDIELCKVAQAAELELEGLWRLRTRALLVRCR